MKICWTLFILLALTGSVAASPDTLHHQENITISVLTCGVGEELYASFGHTAVRVVNRQQGTDIVYNYGTFDFTDPDFYSKFTLGKLLYYLAEEDFANFAATYQQEGRGIDEQVLQLDETEKYKLIQFLETNLLPQNRAYRYDFLYDNCATRVRDIFPEILGKRFVYGPSMNKQPLSFREAIDRRLADKHWQRFGIDLILGSPVDKKMDENSAMFLPDYLYEGLKGARYKNAPLVVNRNLLPGTQETTKPVVNAPFMVMLSVLLLYTVTYFMKNKWLNHLLRVMVLVLTGLLGLQLLFMWFVTNHQSCDNNWNVLWALPTNIIAAFQVQKKRTWLRYYGLFALFALAAALLIHITGIQELPLLELFPLLLVLLLINGDLLFVKRKVNVSPGQQR